MPVIEIVSWNAKDNTADKDMIAALNNLVPDLKNLPGFLEQSTGKDANGRWVDVYYWDSVENAHASNELMANKSSLTALMALLEPDSVTIQVIEPLQTSVNS
ncbi:hypothetical protein [Motiliproteus sp. MSK22-1]|uniref:hypothetical protein n=1 Tax=Motiliproteus sp. MSK22-1 TaxID=1897630 RepID=UPI000977D022|nr:hypothetical protein [Motiliproteus sp. MSK22-1]OMH29082.1 hypothetical protein BGP75_20215 [Motiliproteus sp. MSK22-1]